jgi:hypothetical protein
VQKSDFLSSVYQTKHKKMFSPLSHLYNPNTDNPSFDDLIKTGIVLDEKGTVDVQKPETITLSILHVVQVASGRGLYRGWISNLQKSIRRGQAREACKSAYECGIMDGPFLSNVINRVCKVIVSEDIGCCNLFLPIKVANFLDEIKNKSLNCTEKLDKLFEIIVDMCDSNKSRIVDIGLHLQRNLTCFKQAQKYENFDQSFNGLKKFMSMNELLGSIHALEHCMDYGKEIMKDEKITNEYLLINKSQHYMKSKIFKVWDMLCSIETCKNEQILKTNVALFKISIENKGNESILNMIHAICNIIYQDKLDYKDRYIKDKIYTCETIKDCNDIWIQSAAYDKHVSRWKHPDRNTVDFFYLYGSKIDCTLPSMYKIENQMYNLMLQLITKQ